MYKLYEVEDQQILQDHYDKYEGRVRTLMQYFLDGNSITLHIGGSKNHVDLTIKISPDGYTKAFLEKYIKPENLWILLCGTLSQHLDVVLEVQENLGDNLLGVSITLETYKDMLKEDDAGVEYIDDFHTIMRYIFVERIFDCVENKVKIFDKTHFIEVRGLDYCPYCGEESIDIEHEEGATDWKGPIDHFLPKSLYPYLGICFYNLIPSCDKCNGLSAKAAHNPYNPKSATWMMRNPYGYYPEIIKFSADYNDLGFLNPKNITINVDAETSDYEEGYYRWLKLRSRYQKKRQVAMDIYRQFITMSKENQKFIEKLGVERDFFQDAALWLLGFPIDDRYASSQQYYKFKTEVMVDMLRKRLVR